VKGYVLNVSGVVETGADINITVIGCSGSGCAATDTTDSNGFYIETNLNVLPGDNVSVRASKGTAFATASGIATGSGSVGVATINVTMCVAPQIPSLTAVPDSHNNSVFSMTWTTFKIGLEYDEFQFDSESTNTSANSPQVRTNVAYQTHTWKVRTCNALCCSDYATDSFVTVNNLPAQPTLVDEGNTNQNTITFNWTHSGTDADGDTVTFDFQLDGVTTSNVTSPYTVSGITSGSHTWGVRSCDTISCTAFSQDSFSITNSAAATPTLVDQPHTSSTTIDLEWTNYSDPESDATRNEFQLSTDSNFSTIVANDSNADSPYATNTLSTFTLYFWRMRTCDAQNACSGYASDLFFVYSATNGSTTIVVSGGTKTKIVNGTCEPQWECGDWNICSSRGVTTRTCVDVNDCAGNIPSEYNYCTYAGPRTEEPLPPSSEGRYFLGNFNENPMLQAELGTDEEWEFIYGADTHIVRVLSITDEGAMIEISSEIREYFIPRNGSTNVDLDEDGVDDAEIRIIQKNHKTVGLVFNLLHEVPEERLPLSGELLVKRIQDQVRNSGMIPWILLSIIGVLGSIMYYQYSTYVVREKKTDAALTKYIQSAMSKGFTKQHIQQKLLMSGFAQEEIDYIFNKLERSKNAVPQEH
ncbi:MAG TPA: hypothetical protein VKE88_00905, partial [Candidatus Nanoarchaeia archaeon]|nr:hypothetical protein [Candidatus Nanoarchaeia archaeon]